MTWQFTEGENGHRDYYWGRYGTSQAWAQRDFDRRADDYQQLYHAAVSYTHLNLHEVDTWMFFKWVFKTFVAVMILTNTFNIVLAVFDVSQHVIQQSAGIIQNGRCV